MDVWPFVSIGTRAADNPPRGPRLPPLSKVACELFCGWDQGFWKSGVEIAFLEDGSSIDVKTVPEDRHQNRGVVGLRSFR